jgi:hypothetical protein
MRRHAYAEMSTLTPHSAKLSCCTHPKGPKLSALMVCRQGS